MKLALKCNRYDIKYIIFMFCFMSIIGGILEIGYMLIVEQRFVIGGFFNAPIRPIYGFGGLIIHLLPMKLKRNKIYIFLSSLIACSAFEYLSSFIIETFFNKPMWDYSNFLFNINGRVCLLHSVIWGILGIIFVIKIEPFIEKCYNNIFEKSLKKLFY